MQTGSTGGQLLQSTICIAVSYTATTDVDSVPVPHEYLWWSWGKISSGAHFQFGAV